MDIVTKSNWSLRTLFLLSLMVTTGLFAANSTSSSVTKTQKISVDKVSETIPVIEAKISTSQFASLGLALKIDDINLNISLDKTTLDSKRSLIVPANPNRAAWYKQGPVIGEAGTAIITGHLDSQAGPGVFFNLKKLTAGDQIQVQRADGKIATYIVDKLESFAQDHTFPWNLVYATSGASAIRIITCDGVYNPKTGRYSRNLVVYASLVSLE
jgi:LPXTG-site transpeptidase (sortase) family protein